MTYGLIAELADYHRGDRLREANRHRQMTVIGTAKPNPGSRGAKLASSCRRKAGLLLVETGLHLIARTVPAVPTSSSRG